MTLQSRERGDKAERRCARCKRPKTLDGFGRYRCSRTGKIRVESWCRACRTEYGQAYVAKRRSTPEGLAKDRARRTEWTREWRARNPEKVRQATHDYWERVKRDPTRHALRKENQRIDERLRRERAGKPIRPTSKQRWVGLGGRVLLDPEPLLMVIPILEAKGTNSDGLTRALYRIKHGESKRVELSIVDAVAIRIGLMPHDIYPELAA